MGEARSRVKAAVEAVRKPAMIEKVGQPVRVVAERAT